MAAYPQYGGTNGVPELDVGQEGGTRHTANQARFSGVRVIRDADDTAVAEHGPAQQNVRFESIEGFTGKTVRWEGRIVTDTLATLNTIRDELDALKHGGLGTPDPSLLKSTTLTDRAGNVISETARLRDWRPQGAVETISGDANFTRSLRLTLTFRCFK